jgi:dTDP-glucose pyrophosphorylase
LNKEYELWQNTVVPLDSIMAEAVKKLNTFQFKLVMVADSKNKLLGTISDGDIRRGLLSGYNLETSIDKIMNKSPIVVTGDTTKESVNELMIRFKIQQIPILNEDFEIIGLHLWHELVTPELHPNTIVIMAGGKGTRMYPYTNTCPKPLLRIAGKPILEHIINRAKIQGFTNFVFAINYLGQMIEDHFGDGNKFGVKIQYLRETSYLGTGGALSLLNPKPDSSFIVTNGDIISDINYAELLNFHQQNRAHATMAVREYQWQNPFGVVKTQGLDVIGFEEKPITRSHINAGVYVLEPAALSLLEKSLPCDMPTILIRLQENSKRVIAFPVHEEWIDIGQPIQFEHATAKLINSNE